MLSNNILTLTYPDETLTKSQNYLTCYHIILHFDALNIYSCNKQFLLFSQCLRPFMAPLIFHFKCTLICFHLDQSKILLSGNGIKLDLSQLKAAEDKNFNSAFMMKFSSKMEENILNKGENYPFPPYPTSIFSLFYHVL